jgi:hypothetical protein
MERSNATASTPSTPTASGSSCAIAGEAMSGCGATGMGRRRRDVLSAPALFEHGGFFALGRRANRASAAASSASGPTLARNARS